MSDCPPGCRVNFNILYIELFAVAKSVRNVGNTFLPDLRSKLK